MASVNPMPSKPWWIDRITRLLTAGDVGAMDLGALWHCAEQLGFVRDNVDLLLLPVDFLAWPQAKPLWRQFEVRQLHVSQQLALVGSALARQMRDGDMGPARFRAAWEGLGYRPNDEGGGTPADDYLDAMFHVSRQTDGEARPSFGTLNLASRAQRIADFLAVTQPNEGDRVIDLGSGNGKLALTVAASTLANVRGVELGGSYVAAAKQSATALLLANVEFIHSDVQDVDLSSGSIFYLYYPFHGAVAETVAATLGRLARAQEITIYLAGPAHEFGEYFLKQVDSRSLELSERRGAFGEVLVLRSPRV